MTSFSNNTIYSKPQKLNETQNYVHITWDHFGNKFHIHLSQTEMSEEKDLVETLYGKVHSLLPEFRGLLACEDDQGHEVKKLKINNKLIIKIILNNNNQIRSLLFKRSNRLNVYTSLTGNTPSHLAASDFFEGSTVGDGEHYLKKNPVPSGKVKTPISSFRSFPIFIRGSWIGPNKFIGGGYWGGIGPIPSNRYWQTVAGGRPPW